MLRSLDHVPVGTVVYTRESGVIFASESFADIVGHRLQTIYGKHMEDFTFADDQATSRWLLSSAISNRLPFTLKKRYVRPNGDLIWVENHYQILGSQIDDVVICLISRRLDSLPMPPVLLHFPEGEDASDYIRDMSLDLSAMAELSRREMAADLLRLVAKVANED